MEGNEGFIPDQLAPTTLWQVQALQRGTASFERRTWILRYCRLALHESRFVVQIAKFRTPRRQEYDRCGLILAFE
jgi:hypothetical protein